nr:hypothetical protein [Burkholderia cenocepacia]
MVGVCRPGAGGLAGVVGRRGESGRRHFVRLVRRRWLVVELQFVEFVQFQLVQFEQLRGLFVELSERGASQ